MPTKQVLLMRKEYCYEAIIDIEQDVSEAVGRLETNDDGFVEGTIVVEIWYDKDQ